VRQSKSLAGLKRSFEFITNAGLAEKLAASYSRQATVSGTESLRLWRKVKTICGIIFKISYKKLHTFFENKTQVNFY
jgi:hypothetical protein